MAPPKDSAEKIYIGIPKWVMPLVLTLLGALIIGVFTLMVALFGRVSETEKTLKDNLINKEEYLRLKFEHQQLMEAKKTSDQNNEELMNWIRAQQKKEERR